MEPVDSSAQVPFARRLDDDAVTTLLAWVGTIDRAEMAAGYAPRLAAVARSLTDSGMDALTTSGALATLNDELTRRLLRLAEDALGPPLCPYAWMVLGSGGRMEQALLTDQDSALAYAEGGAATEAYFARLAEIVVGGLLTAGFPPCRGGYMASNWRRSLVEWQATIRNWFERPGSQGVIEAEIFQDFRRVHGDLELEPLQAMLRRGADRPRFLILMARAAVTFEPPLRFGRISSHDHLVDLKRGGLAAIVLLARLHALMARSPARPTPDRLAAAAGAGTISLPGAARLTEVYRLFADLRLGSQLRKVAAGAPPDNLVSLDELTPAQRDRLREAFRAIRVRQRATAAQFYTDTTL